MDALEELEKYQKDNEVLKQHLLNHEENDQDGKTIADLKVQVEESKNKMTNLLCQLQESDKTYQANEISIPRRRTRRDGCSKPEAYYRKGI